MVSDMPRYIDADALLESLKNFTYAEPCTEFQRGVNAVVPLILSEIKHFHLADVVQAPEKTCSTCQCNKVCDHNKYGFENCGNYISDDLLPRASEIFEEIDNALHDMATEYTNAGHTEYFAVCEMVHHKVMRPIEKKYTEEGK